MLQSIGNDVLVPGVKNLLLALGDLAISVTNLKRGCCVESLLDSLFQNAGPNRNSRFIQRMNEKQHYAVETSLVLVCSVIRS
jgi:hypothetical protein